MTLTSRAGGAVDFEAGRREAVQRLRVPGVRTQAQVDDTATADLGLYPIVTFQYSSTNLYQFYCHILKVAVLLTWADKVHVPR